MSEPLKRIKEILSKELSDNKVQDLMAELTIASGNGSVAIKGDAKGAVILTGKQHIVGDNNNVVINEGVSLEKLYEMLHSIQKNPSVSENITETNIEIYRKEASRLIHISYRTDGNINSECTADLKTLRERIRLSESQADTINQEFLQKCHDELQNLKKYHKEAEELIRRSPILSGDVLTKLEAKRIAYMVDERAESQFLNLMGCHFINEREYTRAEACVQKAKEILESQQLKFDPVIYVNLATIRLKQGNLPRALDLLRQAEELYVQQGFPNREVNTVRDNIKMIETAAASKKNFFQRFLNS